MKIVINLPEEIIEYVKNNGCLSVIYNDEVAKAITNSMPYEEKPKGEWTIDEEWDVLGKCKVTIYTCPFCGKVEYEPFDYCRCGADMRKEKEDEDSN